MSASDNLLPAQLRAALSVRRKRAVADRARKPSAVLLPLPGGVDEPVVSFGRDDDALTIRVQWPGRRDEIAWPMAGNRKPAVDMG